MSQSEEKVTTRPRLGSLERIQIARQNVEVPWATKMMTGLELLRNPTYNKSEAFNRAERRQLQLDGLLPPAVHTMEVQVQRVLANLKYCSTDLDKYTLLMNLGQMNQRLFYKVLLSDPNRMLPLVYTPTVGKACQLFGHLASNKTGMYISLRDRGNVLRVLNNWPAQTVRAIVVTDGERILGLGDLGAYGMGIPIGKLTLYTALGGVDPRHCLPVLIDVGTDNEELLADPLYTGLRQHRERGDAYDALIAEFVDAVRIRWGARTLIQWEDFANRNAFPLLNKYRDECCTFNDDIQGTASVSLAGVLSYVRAIKSTIGEQKIVFFGAGSAGIGIADLLAYAMHLEDGVAVEDARKNIFLVDSRGLITANRPSGGLNAEKSRYAHEHEHMGVGLAAICKAVKATCLIGVSTIPQTFTKEVCEQMAANCAEPLIFALSNPTSKAECTAEQAYQWTEGKAWFCSGSPFDPVELKGRTFHPGQSNNSYIFPGVALGVLACGSRRVPEKFFYVAAKALAETVEDSDLKLGCLFPNMNMIREVSTSIAVAVAEASYAMNLSTVFPQPEDLTTFIKSSMYDTEYNQYVHSSMCGDDDIY